VHPPLDIPTSQSPYASVESLNNAGRTNKADINFLEQALAKTMGRQNSGHQHPSTSSSGHTIHEHHTEPPLAEVPQAEVPHIDMPYSDVHPTEAPLTDPSGLGDMQDPLQDEQLSDTDHKPALEAQDSSSLLPQSVPVETQSEPNLSAPKVKTVSRFKVEAVKDDPLIIAKSDEQEVRPEVKSEKRGRFQVTKIDTDSIVSPTDSQSQSPAVNTTDNNTNVSHESSAKHDVKDNHLSANAHIDATGGGTVEISLPKHTADEAVQTRSPTPSPDKINPHKVKGDMAALHVDADYQALLEKQMTERKEYLHSKGYDKDVINFEINKHSQHHPFLTEAVGSPAFLGGVSPSFNSQGSPGNLNLFHGYPHFRDQNFDACAAAEAAAAALAKTPLRIDASGKAKVTRGMDELMRYADLGQTTTPGELRKNDSKKTLNELRVEQEGRWDNFDSVGSSGLGSSSGAEMLDTTRDTSASNSRKSSIDMTGSQSSIPDLLNTYQQQHSQPENSNTLPHPHFTSTSSHPHMSSQTGNPATFNPFMASQFHPFAAMPPFGSFQSFPMTSTSQQTSPFPPTSLTNIGQYSMSPYTMAQSFPGQGYSEGPRAPLAPGNPPVQAIPTITAPASVPPTSQTLPQGATTGLPSTMSGAQPTSVAATPTPTQQTTPASSQQQQQQQAGQSNSG